MMPPLWTAGGRRHMISRVGGGLLVLVTALALAPGTTHADSPIEVTPTSSCTLPEAVDYANGGSEPNCSTATPSGTTTINLGPGTYTLTATLSLNADVNLVGAEASSTTISGNHAVQVVSVGSGVTATISGVTITAGLSAGPTVFCETCDLSGASGGGIANAGTLTLSGVAVTHNAAHGGADGFDDEGGCVYDPPTYGCSSSPPGPGGDGGSGGGIENTGTLTIEHSTISDNDAGAGGSGEAGQGGTGTYAGAGQAGSAGGSGGSGGGIDNAAGATLTLAGSTVSANQAGAGGDGAVGSQATQTGTDGGNAGAAGTAGVGGGISNFGTMTVTDSTVADNSAGAGGNGATGGLGAFEPDGSPTPGSSGGDGGGIYTAAPPPSSMSPGSPASTLTNVTVTGNTAPTGGNGGTPLGSATGGQGGGIFHSGALLTLSFVTVAGNTAAGNAGGVENANRSVSEANSVIAANFGPAPVNCSTGISDAGDNVVDGDTSCPGVNADPELGPLQDNGGPVQTMALGPGSAAVDLVPASTCTAATDARGVSRPQGSGCDAGAYELAPPTVSGASAGTPSVNGTSITAAIDPNGSSADTSVTVQYGTSASYTQSTIAQNLGRGLTSVGFSAGLSDLQAGTTYHFAVVATNADGTTTTADGSFTTPSTPTAGGTPVSGSTPSPLSATLDSAKPAGSTLGVTVACSGGAASDLCSGSFTLTSHVSTKHKQVVAVTALATAAQQPAPKTVTRVETVGSGTYAVSTGGSRLITLTLNATGRKLLDARYRLPATLTTNGTLTDKRTVTFSYAVLKARISAKWAAGARATTVGALTVGKIPSGAKVTVLCRGGGCPFTTRTFTAEHGTAGLTAAFTKARLRPGASVEIEVTHAGEVGTVAVFTVRAGAAPKLADRCLVPGTKQPAACVR